MESYTYIHEPPLSCPLSVFSGLQDKHIGLCNFDGWREQTTGPFSWHTLPGGHFFLHNSEALLLTLIDRHLTRILQGSPRTLGPIGGFLFADPM